jgi:integrase
MLEELERRNFSQNTTRTYVRIVEDFARYFHRQPDQLGPEHIREYQAHLFRQRKLAAHTVTQHVAAIRFLFVKTLKKSWSVAATPYPKRAVRLPAILSQDEVACLIDAALNPFHRVLLMTLYATGVRRAELTHLKISDIDSQRMVIHIQGGKGRKDRDVMLSPKLLEALREHWRGLRRKPRVWLFPGNRWHTGDQPIHTNVGPPRSGENHDLSAPFPAPSQRHRESAGCAAAEGRADTRRVDVPAATGGGRSHPRRGKHIHRAEPQVAHVAARESLAGD